MRIMPTSLVCTLATALAGCSVHPLPDDISRESTYSIIQNIRCEAKATVKTAVEKLLLNSPSPIVQSIKAEDVLAKLDTIRVHDPEVAGKINTYRSTAIGYFFVFKITENNDAKNGSASFILPWANSSFSLDITGANTRKRFSERKIGVVETFAELAALRCSDVWDPRPNRLYPITGSVGMAEIINSFLRLAESVGSNKKFSDSITFTTTINAGADPTLELKQVRNRLRLTKASAKFSADRKDEHALFVALTFPVTKKKRVGPRSFVATRSRRFVSPKALEERRAINDISEIDNETKTKAAEELCIQQALVQEQLTGVVRLNPPEEYCQNDLRRY